MDADYAEDYDLGRFFPSNYLDIALLIQIVFVNMALPFKDYY